MIDNLISFITIFPKYLEVGKIFTTHRIH